MNASQSPQKGNAAVTCLKDIAASRCPRGVQEATKDGFPFPSMFNALAAQGLPSQSAVSEQELPPLPLPQPAAVTDTSGHKYDSPLRVFRSYRSTDSPLVCCPLQTMSCHAAAIYSCPVHLYASISCTLFSISLMGFHAVWDDEKRSQSTFRQCAFLFISQRSSTEELFWFRAPCIHSSIDALYVCVPCIHPGRGRNAHRTAASPVCLMHTCLDSKSFLIGAFSACRLCDTFQTVSQLPLASPSFTHGLDPHWPLCTYDIRGSCRDAKCQYQHASDYQLENVAVLRDLHSQAIRSVSSLGPFMHTGQPLCKSLFRLPRYH